MAARERFRIEQVVRLSAAAAEFNIKVYAGQGRGNRVSTGIVTGFGRRPEQVRIHPDGASTVTTFHMDFWEPIEDPQG